MSAEHAFTRLCSILDGAFGPERAAKIDDLAEYCWVPRRTMENILQTRLEDIPFPVIAGTTGYFRPNTAEEINHYLSDLESRNRCVFLRRRTVIRKALAAGFKRVGKRFVDANPQKELQL